VSANAPIAIVSPKVAKRQGQTRARLLEESALLFIKRGFENVSVEDILAASGIARSSFYRYFSNREVLLAEIVRPVFERGLYELESIPNDSPRSIMVRIFETYLTLWELNANALRVATRVGGVYFSLFEDVHREFRQQLVDKVGQVQSADVLLNGDTNFSARLIARVAIPTLEVFSSDPNYRRLFVTAMEGLLLKPEPAL
jgi:AcrR family transcriptional regulator